ncbi:MULTISPECIES: hypothetical protein [unclassified Haematobacter]|uniref:hypothetical protein n=1 Tax=unclassified Haematobacter TaxID=2640585 RepID=UPI0039185355
MLSARKAVQQGFITLEMSLCGLLWNFGLKVGTISRSRFEQHIRELAAGNPMREAATESMLRAARHCGESWRVLNAMSVNSPKRIQDVVGGCRCPESALLWR